MFSFFKKYLIQVQLIYNVVLISAVQLSDTWNLNYDTMEQKQIGTSALSSVLPVNIQGRFPLGLTGLVSLLSRGLSSLLQHHSSKASVFQCSAFFMVQLSHPHMTTGKTIALTRQMFVGKVMSLLSNMLSRLVIAFLPRSQVSFNFMTAFLCKVTKRTGTSTLNTIDRQFQSF